MIYPIGSIIKRTDGGPFPTDSPWAVVRKPEKALPNNYPAVWIEGGQWVAAHEVMEVNSADIARMAVAGAMKKSDGEHVQKLLELQQRLASQENVSKRVQKKAAKANEEISTWMARAYKAERELKNSQSTRFLYDIRRQDGELAKLKIQLIERIISGEIIPEDLRFE